MGCIGKNLTCVVNWQIGIVFAALRRIQRRRDSRQAAKVIDEMRLIVVTARQRYIGPIRTLLAGYQLEGTLETLHTAELLGCHADIRTEHLNEAG